MKILIVEDEKELALSIQQYLQKENYVCEIATNIKEGREKIEYFDYDCILLDIMLPGGSGLTLLEELKQDKKMDGVIIVSAKNSLEDRIFSLKAGADDYLSKPFHLAELSARVQSIIRRRQMGGSNEISFQDIKIDIRAKAVFVENKEICLTKTEFELLLFMVMNKGRVISKNAIAEHLSGQSAMYFDNFDIIYTHIKNLKKKLSSMGSSIKTIYGTGYKLS
ncbi:response regulator transcription factor [Arachidicoccus sp.]|jgi:DNA-binding response OmpR family regulator|uniref:response regulator transcription factor n=1 Tax=Arachidicoccus sp. TaxID=1872624 RepID=UPI003D25A3FB